MRLHFVKRALPTLCAAVWLMGGCASYSGSSLKPGIATAIEVRQTMGLPRDVYREADGGEIWEYPRGPHGFHTYMAHFDKAGVLRDIEQVLDEHTSSRLEMGKSMRQDVLRRIGSPGRTSYFKRRNEEIWDYRFMDAWGYPSQLHVIFNEAGVVAYTLTIHEHPPGEAAGQ